MKLKVSNTPPYDPYQCFVRDNHIALSHTNKGELNGLVFSVKDVFDVKGSTYSNGHPEWLVSHPMATQNATAIDLLLSEGADLVGKTICDELCFSISGENWHYGSPIHPLDPMRYTGGSSSGSAVSVAAELVDFSIGSDCLGSVRVPASYNGLYGFRPTYKRVDNTGEAPYCESMDVLGWMAKELDVFKKVSKVLLKEDKQDFDLKNVYTYQMELESFKKIELKDDDYLETFRLVQGYEVNQSYKEWITDFKPIIHQGPKQRLKWASTITLKEYQQALQRKKEIEQEFVNLLGNDSIIICPTASSVAIDRRASLDEINQIRQDSSKLLCLSPLSNTPQVTLPLMTKDNLPFGISFIGPVNSDVALLEKAISLATQIIDS